MKLKKRILGLLLALSILIVPTTQVFAATPTFWCEFLGNIKNVTYYVSTSANSTYINQINLAISNWRSSSYLNNKPVLNKTSNVSSYALAYYTYSSGPDMNTLGITKHFTTGSHQVHPDSNNWNFAEVYINNSTINRTNYGRLNPPFTYNQWIQGIIAHETGHALGLSHNMYNTSSLMYYQATGWKAYVIQKEDGDAYNTLY